MLIVAVLCAVTAAAFGIRAGTGPERLDAHPAIVRAPRRHGRVLLACLGTLTAPVAAGLFGGHRAAVLASVGVIMAVTAGYVGRRQWRNRRARRARRDVSEGCAALAALLAAGQVPDVALRAVAADWPLFRDAAVTAQLGGDPHEVWLRSCTAPGMSGLRELAQGWALARRTGAPLAGVLDTVSASLQHDAELSHTVTAELAASRATGRMLSGLPVFGLLLGFAFGGNPVAFLLDQPPGWICALAASACAGAGIIWTERLADRSETW